MTGPIRRWRVWREYSRLAGRHLYLGYSLTAYSDALYRAEAERRVP